MAACSALEDDQWGFLDQVCLASGLTDANHEFDDLPLPVQALFKYWAIHKQQGIRLEPGDPEPLIVGYNVEMRSDAHAGQVPEGLQQPASLA